MERLDSLSTTFWHGGSLGLTSGERLLIVNKSYYISPGLRGLNKRPGYSLTKLYDNRKPKILQSLMTKSWIRILLEYFCEISCFYGLLCIWLSFIFPLSVSDDIILQVVILINCWPEHPLSTSWSPYSQPSQLDMATFMTHFLFSLFKMKEYLLLLEISFFNTSNSGSVTSISTSSIKVEMDKVWGRPQPLAGPGWCWWTGLR